MLRAERREYRIPGLPQHIPTGMHDEPRGFSQMPIPFFLRIWGRLRGRIPTSSLSDTSIVSSPSMTQKKEKSSIMLLRNVPAVRIHPEQRQELEAVGGFRQGRQAGGGFTGKGGGFGISDGNLPHLLRGNLPGSSPAGGCERFSRNGRTVRRRYSESIKRQLMRHVQAAGLLRV